CARELAVIGESFEGFDRSLSRGSSLVKPSLRPAVLRYPGALDFSAALTALVVRPSRLRERLDEHLLGRVEVAAFTKREGVVGEHLGPRWQISIEKVDRSLEEADPCSGVTSGRCAAASIGKHSARPRANQRRIGVDLRELDAVVVCLLEVVRQYL